jgi:nicotinamidase-related amidase
LPPRIGESPLPEEAIVTKHRYGAFESSDLDRSQGIRTVIMTGVATNTPRHRFQGQCGGSAP